MNDREPIERKIIRSPLFRLFSIIIFPTFLWAIFAHNTFLLEICLIIYCIVGVFLFFIVQYVKYKRRVEHPD